MAEDSFVFVRRNAPPPQICFKCGTSESVSLVPFHFHVTPDDSTAEDVANAAGLAVSAVGDAATLVKLARMVRETREATLPVPLCPACAMRWKRARWLRLFAWVPGFAILLAFIAYALMQSGPLLGTSHKEKMVFVALFSLAAWVLFALLPKLVEQRVAEPATCAAVAITSDWVALVRVHPSAAAELVATPAPQELLKGSLHDG
jgi:hypothetical protein